ncbi:MAG TPA: VWA domain-containing protein [Woeseiaceae bacterium]
MAEPEEVLSDVARHATVFVRDLWQRHRERQGGDAPTVPLSELAERLDLFVMSVFGRPFPLRIAVPPAPPTLLTLVFGRRRGPLQRTPVPATDGVSVWLPADLGLTDRALALERYRAMVLAQAMRAERGGAALIAGDPAPLVRDVFLLLEACAADAALARLLPGTAASLNALRQSALAARPALSAFPKEAQPLERFLRQILQNDCARPDPAAAPSSAAASLEQARRLAADLVPGGSKATRRDTPLYRDVWTGELRPPPRDEPLATVDRDPAADEHRGPTRSTRVARRPDVRKPKRDEDRDRGRSGAWMVQADEPHQKAEDPMGLQRPTDRDDLDRADEMGEMLSELEQARTVSTPGRPKEVILSDDPPPSRSRLANPARPRGEALHYPEWDYRAQAYRVPGATVHRLEAPPGPQAWVDDTLARHHGLLAHVRRRFEMLHARRATLRRQPDGEEVDLDACVEAIADFRAGARLPGGLYQTSRPRRRDLAILLLIDASGSTDGWVAAHRRVIDVEREALLLVCLALEELGEPYAVQAFSGEGPDAVSVQELKGFDQPFDSAAALRIAALEPDRYTRAGAALRHATATLMQKAAQHRLLLLLSDGKPNDLDHYQGRYGVEDMQRAVSEAKLSGIYPFCLTIDRQAADYLPRVFGPSQYALLPRPELLPTVLLDWVRRLLRPAA